MRKANKLKKSERSEISILLGRGYSMRAISKALNRSPNTISYEVRENSTLGVYDPIKASAKARVDARRRRYQWAKITQNTELERYVVQGLENHWNPDEISKRMKLEKKPWYASKTAIYDWLQSNRGQQYCPLLYSKRYRKKKHTKKTERVMIPGRTPIQSRPAGADNRSRYGHWEADAIVSCKGGSGALAVTAERKSRLILAQKVKNLSPGRYAETLNGMLEYAKVGSITFDNGMENRNHQNLDVPTFFCDPYSSWQKGTVENANKMIRRYLPKGTNFAEVPQSYVDEAIRIINNKPRKILGYKTALEVASASGVLLSNESALIQG